jgi:hypothetical protein
MKLGFNCVVFRVLITSVENNILFAGVLGPRRSHTVLEGRPELS